MSSFQKIQLTANQWTLVSSLTNKITFVNSSVTPLYIITTSSNTQPTSNVGMIYRYHEGETDISIATCMFLLETKAMFGQKLLPVKVL